MKRFCLSLTIIAALALATPAHAQSSFTVKISAGEHDRTNTPVLIETPLEDMTGVTVTNTQGKSVPAQLVGPGLLSSGKNMHLLLAVPQLKAGETAQYTVTETSTAPASSQSQFVASEAQKEFLQIAFGDRPVLRFMVKPLDESTPAAREQTYKVFHHVFDPENGEKIVTKGPGGQFTHHRGLFFGFNKVSYNNDATKCDIWHCKGAHQSYDGLVNMFMGPLAGRHRVKVGWHGPEKEVFASEMREVTAYNLPGGTLIEFASHVASKVGPITLDGDPQHAGFHFRADNEVAEKTKGQTYYLRPDGQDSPGKTRNWDHKGRDPKTINLPWNAMSFVLDDQRYTAVYLDHPRNPKEARYSERDYGRFGSYFEYQITADKPLEVNYRIWLQRGELTGAQVAALSADFVNPPRGEVTAGK